jgi:hypothetical protein
MAKLYFNEQLIATSSVHGIVGDNLINEEIVITYPNLKKKYYTVIIYDQNDIHSLLINVKGDDLTTGDILVEYIPFKIRLINYDATVYIYEQLNKIPLPDDDFDFEEFNNKYQLKLLYTIEFTILQKLEKKPNIYSNRVYYQKLKKLK